MFVCLFCSPSYIYQFYLPHFCSIVKSKPLSNIFRVNHFYFFNLSLLNFTIMTLSSVIELCYLHRCKCHCYYYLQYFDLQDLFFVKTFCFYFLTMASVLFALEVFSCFAIINVPTIYYFPTIYFQLHIFIFQTQCFSFTGLTWRIKT